MRAEDRISFARAVWHEFRLKAQTKRDMSSAEYVLIGRWMDRPIPLPVVLRGIGDFVGRPRRLEAVEQSVDRSAAYWHQAMGGVPVERPADPWEPPL